MSMILGAIDPRKPWKGQNVGQGSPLPVGPGFPANGFQSGVIALTTTNPTQVVPAGASSSPAQRNYITEVIATNESATATVLRILDGATELARIAVPAGTTVSRGFQAQALRGSGATALSVASSVAVTTLNVTVAGFTA